jgi:TatD related DNase
MLGRSKRAGVMSMIITGGSLSESKLALNLAKEHSTCQSPHGFQGEIIRNIVGLYATVGCHPTRSAEFEKDPARYFAALDELVKANLIGPGRAVAIGECGLDYDRIHFASTTMQQKAFRACNLGFRVPSIVLLMLHSQALSLPWRRNTTSLYFCIPALHTMISYEFCRRRGLVRMGDERLAVGVGLCTVSQDLLKMQLTMCVFGIYILGPATTETGHS